jgi:hypothetical protein
MNGLGPGAHWSGLVTGFYTARYIVGMFVTGFPNEAHYRYVGHPYSNLLACRRHPGTSQDLAAIRGCIVEPARIWQPPQQGDITNTLGKARSHL